MVVVNVGQTQSAEFFQVIINCIEQKAFSRACGQEVLNLFRQPKFSYRVD
jgi:hypothetical protein